MRVGFCALAASEEDELASRSVWGVALVYPVVMATHWTLGCDASDPHRGPAIGFLRVPEGKTSKNRMHIDIRVAGEQPWDMTDREQLIRAKVTELVGAGAAKVREETYDEHLGHVVMLDPEGNEFCVA